MLGKLAMLIGLDEDLGETEELASTAGYEIIYEVLQRRARPDPNTYIGRGKMRELADLIEERPVDVLLLSGDAKPSQHYNLESGLGIMCIDRVGLILEIFRTRASSREAKLQVERARLRYETPLLKEWIHCAKSGEHPGFMGGGEYAVDVYYDLIKKRIKAIDDELKDIRRDSKHRQVQREKAGVFSISLAGYTNAGKSSMMKALTGEDVLVENRMFSTLSTTTRKLGDAHDKMLITDTIGFLKGLPHFLIESFRTTLDEIYSSDLILLVVDASENDEMIGLKARTSKEILHPKIGPDDLIIILNKIDLLSNKNPYIDIERKKSIIGSIFPDVQVVPCSSVSGQGIDSLMDVIKGQIEMMIKVRIDLPNQPSSQTVISKLFDQCRVDDVSYEKSIKIKARCSLADAGRFSKMVEDAGGRFHRLPNPPGNGPSM